MDGMNRFSWRMARSPMGGGTLRGWNWRHTIASFDFELRHLLETQARALGGQGRRGVEGGVETDEKEDNACIRVLLWEA